MVPNLMEQVRVLEKTASYGKSFTLMDGDHPTSDSRAASQEKTNYRLKIQKNEMLTGIVNEAAAKKILDHGKDIKSFAEVKLMVLL